MKLDTSALLKAGGIGAAAMLVLTLMSLIPIVGFVCCCLLYLGFAGVGVLYGVFAKQSGSPLGAGPGALGGAVSAAIAGLVQGIVSGVATLIMAGAGMMANYLSQVETMGYDIPPELYDFYASSAFGIIAALFSICWGVIIGAILGAVGGAIYGATQQSSTPTTSISTM